MTEIALEMENVSFSYPENRILDHVCFQVERGDFVALVGSNGAGKSTMLKLFAGLLTPNKGQVRIWGQPLAEFRARARIGYVAQNPLRERSFPITVEEVVTLGRVAVSGLGRGLARGDREIVEETLEHLKLTPLRRRVIGALSGGQQQRVLVARALAAQPDLLLLDEPTAGVDHQAKLELYAFLRDYQRSQAKTIVMVSHDVECVAHYAAKIAAVSDGKAQYINADRYREYCPEMAIPAAEAGGVAYV